ncbi:hypothetical protein CVT26_012077 [Gymnopilus dilepis]|uniref:Uncharacterized protein n=1 Tax=Gymnopilus dilepis TaxID=231916 RepID=A0A409X264_9AGAR|nr:hypothetical protein CVT26_012077 [Gymnopilus dilepis]
MAGPDTDIRMRSPSPDSEDSDDDYLATLVGRKNDQAPAPIVTSPAPPSPDALPTGPEDSSAESVVLEPRAPAVPTSFSTPRSQDTALAPPLLQEPTAKNSNSPPPGRLHVTGPSACASSADESSIHPRQADGTSSGGSEGSEEDSDDGYLRDIVCPKGEESSSNVPPAPPPILPGVLFPLSDAGVAELSKESQSHYPRSTASSASGDSDDDDDYLAQFNANTSTAPSSSRPIQPLQSPPPPLCIQVISPGSSDVGEDDYLQQFMKPGPPPQNENISSIPSHDPSPPAIMMISADNVVDTPSDDGSEDNYLDQFTRAPPPEHPRDTSLTDDDDESDYLDQFLPDKKMQGNVLPSAAVTVTASKTTKAPKKIPPRAPVSRVKKAKVPKKISPAAPTASAKNASIPSIISISSPSHLQPSRPSARPAPLPRIFLPGAPETCGEALVDFMTMEDNPFHRDDHPPIPVKPNDLYSVPSVNWYTTYNYRRLRPPSPPPNDFISAGPRPPPNPPLTVEELFLYHKEIENLDGMSYHDAAEHLAKSELEKYHAAESIYFSLTSLHERLLRLSAEGQLSAEPSQPPSAPHQP